MKKLYTSPESFVIELEVEDIVTASKPASVTTAVTTDDIGTTAPIVTTTATPDVDLEPIDPWLPSIPDWE
ncbi:MAG: hypothetical protein IJW16_04525 [Clostridia bacterium]|nr:hypothetical protein [Clostridia bacterium]